MIELDDIFLDSFTGLLDNISDTAQRRAAESGASTQDIWEAVRESGFVDALLSEEQGGAGFETATVVPLIAAAGERLLPVAFAQTMVARMLAARAGVELAGAELNIDGPVVLWPANAAGRLRSQIAPAIWEGGHALVQQGENFSLRPLKPAAAPDGFGYLPAEAEMDGTPLASFSLPDVDLLDWATAITALLMAGACNRVMAITIEYLNERKQFGRPLAKFQALQHMCAQMAEQVVIAGTAARIGFTADGQDLSSLRVAVAKSVTFEAATQVSAIAHACFAAIGVTQEHDLQLYTRALKRWQASFGSDTYWAKQLGKARIAGGHATSADFIRDRLAPEPVE